jgi:phosphoenolpyruvate synthase/pyruvate phosphate dikinase
MLIHGAIIAREYGIPCVTGVPDAVNQIKTGDFITVDGHLGIVIIGKPHYETRRSHWKAESVKAFSASACRG